MKTLKRFEMPLFLQYGKLGNVGSVGQLLQFIFDRVESAALASAILDAIDHSNPGSVGELLQKKRISAILGDIIKEL